MAKVQILSSDSIIAIIIVVVFGQFILCRELNIFNLCLCGLRITCVWDFMILSMNKVY